MSASDSAARAFQLLINRSDLPTEDAPVAALCALTWPAAKLALERADLGDDPQAHSEFFQGMCRWRTHFARTKMGADARAAAFVVTCAARLVMMDAVNGEDQRIDELERALGEWRGEWHRAGRMAQRSRRYRADADGGGRGASHCRT